MLELPLVFVAGFLGSSHCIGMCGPFALSLAGGSRSWSHNLARQLVYTLGRTFTYLVLGAFAGFGGMRLARIAPWLTNVGALLALVAGVWLIYQGLVAAGVWKRRAVEGTQGCLTGEFFRSMLRLPGWSGVFVAGLFTGLLPCGLVYSFLALAAATSSIWLGAATMGVFGVGTAPIMIATGCGGSLLSLSARQHLLRVAAWCLVLTGAISVARGMSFIHRPGVDPPPKCPLCEQREAAHVESATNVLK